MIDKKELIIQRDAEAGDLNFILSTFLRGLYYGDTWYSLIPKDIFMSNYHKIIETILKRLTTRVRVACLKEDPSVILAYSICGYGDTVLHWAYCKKAWRKIHLVKSITPDTIMSVSHLTAVGLSILKSHKGIDFNPFLI